jgi:hypothetical protein
MGTGCFSLEVKRLEREKTTRQSSSAEVKNEWSHISSSTVCLHGVYREIFTVLPLPVYRPALGAHLASYLMGTRDFLQGLKWLGHEEDHKPVHSAGVENA